MLRARRIPCLDAGQVRGGRNSGELLRGLSEEVTGSIPQHAARELFEPRAIEQFDLASLHAQESFVLEAA